MVPDRDGNFTVLGLCVIARKEYGQNRQNHGARQRCQRFQPGKPKSAAHVRVVHIGHHHACGLAKTEGGDGETVR